MQGQPAPPCKAAHSRTIRCASCWLQGIYLVADDADAADAWVDALVLCQHLVGAHCSEALEEALAPTPAKRKQSAAMTM
jgi:hypothetical protein